MVLMIAGTSPAPAGQLGGTAGAFSRMGFGARGMGMGNAMIAVRHGDVFSYYNPALTPWTSAKTGAASFGILSLDRSLNFLGYTMPLPPQAGLSVGIINAGVSDIDGRDSDGEPTGSLRTSENQVFLGFSLKFKPGFSLGLNSKLYYYQLYEDLTTTSVGFDLGAFVPITDRLSAAVTVRDIGSKYRWDTSDLYGQDGRTTEDRFPTLTTAGAAYVLGDSLATIAAEVEFSSAGTTVARFGAEFRIIPELEVRGGVDRIDLAEKGNGIRPALGFTLRKDLSTWTPAVTYAFVMEPFAPQPMHMITLSATF